MFTFVNKRATTICRASLGIPSSPSHKRSIAGKPADLRLSTEGAEKKSDFKRHKK
jgi:hypothetical protein